MAVISRYFSEFGYLPGALRKSSRSISHLVISSCTYGRPINDNGGRGWWSATDELTGQVGSLGLIRRPVSFLRSVCIHQTNQVNSRNGYAHGDNTTQIDAITIIINIGRPFVKRFALCYRYVVCLSVCPVLSVTLVYCG